MCMYVYIYIYIYIVAGACPALRDRAHHFLPRRGSPESHIRSEFISTSIITTVVITSTTLYYFIITTLIIVLH